MRSVRDVEAYLEALGRRHEAVEGKPGTFLLRSRNTGEGKTGENPPIALRIDAPLVVMRLDVGLAPKHNPADVFRSLLEHNARSLVHTSFGLEGDRIVLSAALELENLDMNELEAVLDEMDMTLAHEVPELHALGKQSDSDSASDSRKETERAVSAAAAVAQPTKATPKQS
jgi:hypothetical protein